jgi:formate dehydrogenase major subunit
MQNADRDAALAEAGELIRNGNPDSAIDVLRRHLRSGLPDVHLLLARAYFGRGDAKGDVYSAHFFAKRALELGAADRSELLAIRGVCAFRKEAYEEAIECLSEIEHRQSAALLHVLGIALLAAGRPEEALPRLERAAELGSDPEFAEAARAARDRPEGVERRRWTTRAVGLGGVHRERTPLPSPSRSSALSVLAGDAESPKDFAWHAANVPCQAACPAGTDIPEYLRAIYEDDYDRAYRINLRDNVFPGVLGRVCARPCEAACRHGWEGLGESVAICSSKRAAADRRGASPMVLDAWFGPSGQKVVIVGAGVAGLTVARELARLGHRVLVLEKHSTPGGMMNQGIPEFRLPRDVIEREVDQVRQQGVEIRCGVDVGSDVSLRDLLREHDAVVMAAGTMRPNLLDLAGKSLPGIMHGLEFLARVNAGEAVELGECVLVIGGGFTAMDCARTAARLGVSASSLEPASDGSYRLRGDAVRVLYRRSPSEMLVTPGEVEELGHEGIGMDFMVAPVAFLDDGAGKLWGMRFVRTELGAPDESGRRRPVPVEGSELDLAATTVLLATGQQPDLSWLDASLRDSVGRNGWLASGSDPMTPIPKLFAAGDFATGATSLIDAIAHAKRAAREVDRFLTNRDRLREVIQVEDAADTGRIREMDAVPRVRLPVLPVAARSLTAEVELGFDAEQANDETQRCYLCHLKFEIDPAVCILCDLCMRAKPRADCIVPISQLVYDETERVVGFQRATSTENTELVWIQQSECIRCRACVDACPVDAISIQKVSRTIGPAAGSPKDVPTDARARVPEPLA